MTGVKQERLLVLDVFRGMTIFLMIVVNTQGSGAAPYAQLMHADWNGCTLTDLVFPSFLFAMGNALVFVLVPKAGRTRADLAVKVLKRSLLIFGGLLFYLIELRSWRVGTRFLSVFGRNPLFIYIFSTLTGVLLVWKVSNDQVFIDWINEVLFQRIAPGPAGCLLFSLCIRWFAG